MARRIRLPTTARGWARAGLLLACGLYAASFAMPVVQIFSSEPVRGWSAFLVMAGRAINPEGLSRWAHLEAIVAWSANPFFWTAAGLGAKGKWAWAAVCGAAAEVGALAVGLDLDGRRFDYSEYLVGYYCWLASAAALTGLSLVMALRVPAERVATASGPAVAWVSAVARAPEESPMAEDTTYVEARLAGGIPQFFTRAEWDALDPAKRDEYQVVNDGLTADQVRQRKTDMEVNVATRASYADPGAGGA
jgi:hypothetical protein